MRIIVCHNYYQQPGGEDQVFRDKVTLLESHGHQVATFVIHNDTIRGRSKLKVACDTLWNRRAASELAALVRKEEAEIVHFHNTFPLISPAAYHAVREAGAAVVQTLHNFRLLCPGATFTRDGQVCERCLGKAVPWPAVAHRCYRGSRSGSAVVAAMLAAHRFFRTWDQAVDRYIALTEFARQTFLRGGLPAEKVVVKGNFVAPSPTVGRGQGGYALFAGRLVPEKGLHTLLEAWKWLAEAVPLKILGDGPLAAHVQKSIEGNPAMEWLGSRPHAEVEDILGNAQMLILPSTWYEGFPKILVEALAKGTPVVASRLGAMAELIDDGRTGLLFEPGNAEDLAAKVQQLAGDPCRRAAMRQAARKCFEDNHTAEHNYRQLVAIYRQALAPLRAGACRPENLPMCHPSHVSPFRTVRSLRQLRVDPMKERNKTIRWPVKYDLFGVKVNATTYGEAETLIFDAARQQMPAVVSLHAVHAVVTAAGDPALREKVNGFQIVAPDGQPVRWALNLLYRTGLRDRVYGPELTLRLCRRAAEDGVPVYLYGSTPETIEKLQENLAASFPGLQIAGAEAPPFRPLTPEEDEAMVERINRSAARIVFIGLGCPKQDHFAYDHRDRIEAVQVCVGAAFDFHAGTKQMAPGWLQRHGLEWLYRLGQEPRRLWRRYLVTNSLFAIKLLGAFVRPRAQPEPHFPDGG